MAVRKPEQKDQPTPIETRNDAIEDKLVAFAGQLGYLIGTVQAKAEGWLDRTALRTEVARIRDGAANLLEQMNREGTLQRKAAATRTTTAPAPPPVPAPSAVTTTPRASRGAVDAPGKRHRKPPPRESIDKRMGEPTGKQMGQKSVKNRGRSGRG